VAASTLIDACMAFAVGYIKGEAEHGEARSSRGMIRARAQWAMLCTGAH